MSIYKKDFTGGNIMEITFRGKREDNNEWVYGDLIQNEEGYYISLD